MRPPTYVQRPRIRRHTAWRHRDTNPLRATAPIPARIAQVPPTLSLVSTTLLTNLACKPVTGQRRPGFVDVDPRCHPPRKQRAPALRCVAARPMGTADGSAPRHRTIPSIHRSPRGKTAAGCPLPDTTSSTDDAPVPTMEGFSQSVQPPQSLQVLACRFWHSQTSWWLPVPALSAANQRSPVLPDGEGTPGCGFQNPAPRPHPRGFHHCRAWRV